MSQVQGARFEVQRRMLRCAAACGAMATMLVMAGCRADMQDQPRMFPQRGSEFFADGRSVRPQVENTVARGQLHEDSYFYTGLENGKEGDALPFPATMTVLERGRERYNVYCTPCHSRVGNGEGMIVQRGYRPAGNFHTERLMKVPLGHFFNVMTNGYGAMPEYASQVAPADRWAIVAYIKALQLSQDAKESDAPAGAKVESLKDLATEEGLEPNALNWAMPATAIVGTPNNQDNGIPETATPNGKGPAPVTSQKNAGGK